MKTKETGGSDTAKTVSGAGRSEVAQAKQNIVQKTAPSGTTVLQAKPALPRKAFKLAEVAETLGCSVINCRRLVSSGQLGHIDGFRHILIPAVEVDRYLKERLVYGKGKS